MFMDSLAQDNYVVRFRFPSPPLVSNSQLSVSFLVSITNNTQLKQMNKQTHEPTHNKLNLVFTSDLLQFFPCSKYYTHSACLHILCYLKTAFETSCFYIRQVLMSLACVSGGAMGLLDVQPLLVGFGGGFRPVHLDAVLGAFFFQLFK